jgi:hypothetical protein
MNVGTQAAQVEWHGMGEELWEVVEFRVRQAKILTPTSGTALDRWERVLRCQTNGLGT